MVPAVPVKGRAVLVIHGGAGKLIRDRYPAELQEKYHAVLKMALLAGHAVLASGGCALDAVEATIAVLEDSPLFNAGKGAVYTKEGKVEMDASIMVSHPAAAGDPKGDESRRTTAVTMLKQVKNPITLAKKFYHARVESDHVLHAGPYAEKLAEKWGCEMMEESYFHTPARDRQYEERQAQVVEDNSGIGDYDAKGTVGAVALDVNGYMAVGTSTGGRAGKLPGRIGDTPVPGAGYWCEKFVVEKKSLLQKVFPFLGGSGTATMGVSGTGNGDFYLRYSVCHDIYARMKYKGETLERASKDVLAELGHAGGEGGVIGLTGDGEVIMGMNCSGMFRGWIDLSEGKPRVGIFADDIVH
jgi:beta-aspartyl-peptidase (threonine type)